MHQVSVDAIRAALTYIPANDQDMWVRVGMALKDELGDAGLDMFDVWSQTADNYNPKSVKSRWKSFKAAGGGITLGTLIAEAKDRGFDPQVYKDAAPLSPEEKARLQREKREREQAANAEIQKKQKLAAKEALQIWSAGSAEGASPYLERKKANCYGVRFAGDVLLVPVLDASGKLWNVQRVHASGDKYFLKDGKVSGGFHIIGDVDASEWLLIAEGYATAASLHQATGYAVAIAFNAGNVKHVTKTLRRRHPEKKFMLCADDDRETEEKTGSNPGVVAASAAATAERGHWCKPSGLLPGGTDFNDLALASGLDAVREQLQDAVNAAMPKESSAATSKQDGQEVSDGKPKTTAPAKKARESRIGNKEWVKPFFNVDERGVWFHGFSQQGDPLPAQWICSQLKVTARSRDAGNGEWGYLLEFEDADGKPKRWAMPASELAGDGTRYRSTLLSMGLQIGAGMQAKNQLTVYIQTQQTDMRVRCTDRIGWHDDVYVLPDRTVGEGDEKVMFQSPGGVVSQFKQRGTLEQWRREVGALCRGNSRMLFCVSAAFAAPLLHHSGVPSGGFHIWGDSSSGKSTAFKVAGSVYGGKDYARNWRMTDNALETVAVQHSDALLLLDEIAQVDPKVVGDTVYMLANEAGKGRATQTAIARKVHTWRVLFLSDGEVSLANHMAEAGKGIKGGHDVRMAHIPADAGKGLGVYDTLNDFASGSALSDHLVHMSQQYYGVAGMAFIEWAVARSAKLSEGLRSRVSTLTRELCPADSHGQVARVAARFALVGVAGELATGAGITGWEQGEAIAAAKTCFAAWLDSRGGAGNSEHSNILSQVSGFFQVNGDARFDWWHRASDDRKPKTINRAGFKRMLTKDGKPISSNSDHHREYGDVVHPVDAEQSELEYFVFSEVFKNEICKGFSPKTVTRLLIARGLLVPEGNGEKSRADRKERLPGMGNVRCYRFTSMVASGIVD